jgi:peptidoglycan/xylan/chitin deacetylase (PgdA/CDA1 family)
MYHQFTAKPEGESGWLRGNYAYIGDFEAQMSHIATTGFYLPTWDELDAFIDGRLFLPARSVIITDDDADQSWFDLAVPVIDRYKLLSTSFMITAYRQDPPPSIYVQRRSHTHDMHQAGANGKGRMVNWTAEEIAADLATSGDVLGVREVMAYPYGHYNDTAKQGVAQAGYELARTIEPGLVTIGTDKLALPVVRIDYGMTVDALVARIG